MTRHWTLTLTSPRICSFGGTPVGYVEEKSAAVLFGRSFLRDETGHVELVSNNQPDLQAVVVAQGHAPRVFTIRYKNLVGVSYVTTVEVKDGIVSVVNDARA